jgi:hypothetical protein
VAIVIPRTIDTGADVTVATYLQKAFSEASVVYYNSPSHSTRPRFVVFSPEHGVVALDSCDWAPLDIERADRSGVWLAGRNREQPLERLSERVESLRQQLSDCAGNPLCRIPSRILLPNITAADMARVGLDRYFPPASTLHAAEIRSGRWPDRRTDVAHDDLEDIRARLYPETRFARTRLSRSAGDRTERVSIRVALDAEQEALARSLGDGVVLLTGVSGSGKSLVLAARARVLAAAHPDWTIQLLCFNRALVRYLAELCAGAPQVRVDTFHAWAHHNGVNLPWADDDADRTVEIVQRAIRRGAGRETCDALLIDEAQDFSTAWLQLAYAAVRPGRGGMVIASDPAQSIYRDEAMEGALPILERLILTRNYRNTEQIGRFAYGAVFGTPRRPTGDAVAPYLPDFPVQGDPVRLVWAERWDAQAEFVAKEVRRLVDSAEAGYRDIGILYTQRTGMAHRLLTALEANDIAYHWGNRNPEAKGAIDLNENTVKLMTIHSSKGLEFPFVFVFGVEAIKTAATLKAANDEEANRARLAYVGMTRAQDRLYLTYTRTNAIVERALELSTWCECFNYPEDFDFS